MNRTACVLASTWMALTAPMSAEQMPRETRAMVAIEAEKGDASAMLLTEALREQLRLSVRYQLADGPAQATIVIHVAGLVLPSCRPSTAVAVSYVSLPTERHLGTAVLTTDSTRVVLSARDVLAKLPQLLNRP